MQVAKASTQEYEESLKIVLGTVFGVFGIVGIIFIAILLYRVYKSRQLSLRSGKQEELARKGVVFEVLSGQAWLLAGLFLYYVYV